MTEKPYILVIDGNPFVIEGCKRINDIYGDKFYIETANNCKDAFSKVSLGIVVFNLIILEVSLVPYEVEKLYSGIELAVSARKVNPGCKIVLLTHFSNDFYYYETIKKVTPDGYIVKGGTDCTELLYAINKVLSGATFYCDMVMEALGRIKERGIYFDEINLQIIRLIAQGVRTKNLPLYVPLCISAIDKRKAHIKEIFDIEKGTDEDIIREARINGFI